MRTLLLFCASVSVLAAVDFQRQVRPILSDNCFQCHGPDASTRMAGLRLDQKDAVHAKRSAILARITDARPQRIMPPPQSHKKLSPEQVATLKTWIEAGAPWTAHWAYEAPVRSAANSIDELVLAKLRPLGLTPALEADKRTLARRAALDLTGLPPEPAVLAAFLNDSSAQAYEKLLDTLLASPRYGEHRARYWLDAARYADTHGIHVDNYREMWPYRDWVIQAFNRNLSFDRFTTEQLAGDLLPNPTLEQRIATGFQRCNPTTNEAGLIEDEYAEIYAKDRADTVGAVWLGMTVGCAACHDHKFDPITQKDFYSLGAFFRNTTQNVMDDNIPDTPPVLVVPRAEDRARWEQVSARRTALTAELQRRRLSPDPRFDRWLRSAKKTISAHPLPTKDQLYALPAPLSIVTEGQPVPKAPKLLADQAFTIAVSFYFPKTEQPYVIASQQDAADKGRGWYIDVTSRVSAFRLVGDEGRNVEIRAGHLNQMVYGSWNHIVVAYDGSRHQSGLSFYLNGRAIPTQGGGNQNVELPGRIDSSAPLILGKALPGGEIADFRIFKRVVSETEARLLADWATLRRSEDREALRTYYLFHRDPAYQKLAAEQAQLQLEAKAIARRGAVTHVMQEREGQMPFAHVLYRGAYDQKRARVDASTPSVLPPMPAGLPRNRLGLAQWLVSQENPLTARVAVNRMWQELFGDGLVRTAEDFGSQGQPPVNQELLDWLAIDFRDNGWDMKRFYKQVMLSATYRQAALHTPEKLAKDPENRLLSRGPRFRMDGEMIRDYALASSGLLSPQLGGPSVKPYQPAGVWETVAMNGSNTRFYKPDSGDNLYRRSVYWFWKRSAPPASLDIFNAPTREACTVRRERTNTPLQALVTMNDTQFVEAARVLGQRAYYAGAGFDPRADFLAAAVLQRPLAEPERQIARQAYQDYLRYYDSNLADAKKLLASGEAPVDAKVAPAEGAALTMLANQLLNLDEVLNK
ncbi:MAG: DUF1553 domain-containing protein [Acidobacteria bacterium]|nr:DUF1553 domain-containing protein [Acidobacteriota bacterium]